jgi:hypothetical protein
VSLQPAPLRGRRAAEDREPGLTRATGHVDGAAVTLDDLFDDRQAEPAAAVAAGPRRVGLVEAVEHVGRMRFGNPVARVLHRQPVAVGAQRGLEANRAARRRVAQGVRHQVADHLFQAARIGVDLVRLGRDLRCEDDAGRCRLAFVASHDVVEDALDREHPWFDRRDAGLVPRQIKPSAIRQ